MNKDYCDERWQKHNRHLDGIQNDTLQFLKHPYFRKFIRMPLKKNTRMTNREIDEMFEFFVPKGFRVLEMGAGFGNFCKVLHERTEIASYTILDSKSMLRFSQSYLKHHNIPCTFVEAENYRQLFNKEFDLFISCICIAETPDEYRRDLLENLLPKCSHLFVIDGFMPLPNSPDYVDWLKGVIQKSFNKVTIKKMPFEICLQRNQNLYVGEE